MLNTAKLVSFLAAKDAERAKRFYGDALGLTLIEDSPFAIVFDANGRMLRIQKVDELHPARHTVAGWEVADIAAVVGMLTSRGIVFERYDELGQDENGIWTSPSGAKIAWFKDPEGNLLSLTQLDR